MVKIQSAMSGLNVSKKFEAETGRNFADFMKEVTGNDKMHIRELSPDEKTANINTEKDAYLLGCFACAGSIDINNLDSWSIRVKCNRVGILENLQESLGIRFDSKLEYRCDGFVSLVISNGQWTILGEKLGSPLTPSKFPDLSDNLTKAFIRGCFDVSGNIDKKTHSCSLKFLSQVILCGIQEKIGVTSVVSESGTLEFSGVNVLDFLAKIYENSSHQCRFSHHYSQFCDLLTFYNTDIGRDWAAGSFKCLWKKNDPNALPLRKNRCSDSGFDLALIRKEKQLTSFTALYDTGIAVSPPTGYYFDVVPRSSISKTGYILANCTGIIDASYSGSIKVALLKADDSVPELTLPNYMVQLIPRKYVHMDFQEVAELEQTERSDKGFGSTELQTSQKSK